MFEAREDTRIVRASSDHDTFDRCGKTGLRVDAVFEALADESGLRGVLAFTREPIPTCSLPGRRKAIACNGGAGYRASRAMRTALSNRNAKREAVPPRHVYVDGALYDRTSTTPARACSIVENPEAWAR